MFLVCLLFDKKVFWHSAETFLTFSRFHYQNFPLTFLANFLSFNVMRIKEKSIASSTSEMTINLTRHQKFKLLECSQHHIHDTLQTDKSDFQYKNTKKLS